MLFLLCSVLAAVSASPRPADFLDRLFDSLDDASDAFWDKFDKRMDDLGDNIDTVAQTADNNSGRIEGNNYVSEIGLTGFNKDDISVRVNHGSLQIRAHNKETGGNLFISNGLPSHVGGPPKWTYDNNVLKIVLPITKFPTHTDSGSSMVVIN